MCDSSETAPPAWRVYGSARIDLATGQFGPWGDQPPPPPRPAFASRLKMLESVNLYVNEHVDQATNLEVYGVDQFWTRSGTKHGARGDCKGLSIEKRLELIALGYPAADLFYAIAYQTDMGLHAVLVAHTEVGDLVLDSRSPRIALWSQTAYTWVKRQAPNAPATWVLAMG